MGATSLCMTSKAKKRDELTERIAHLLLAAGMAQIPLRELAADLETSDRMLLYYFTDKADLVQSSLRVISAQLWDMLDSIIPVGPHLPEEFLSLLLDLLNSEPLQPVMNVWADITARGGRGEEPFRGIAAASVAHWLEWLEQRLAITNLDKRRDAAVAILAVVEGARQLEASAPGTTSRLGETLAGAFSKRLRRVAPDGCFRPQSGETKE